MKKQCISFSILFALTLSTVQPLCAVSFKEWAQKVTKKISPQQIKEKAIAATQKLKGLKAKDAWNKIDFVGRADREFRAAREALETCKSKHCTAQQEEAKKAYTSLQKCYPHGRYGCWDQEQKWQKTDRKIRQCAQTACAVENLSYRKAINKQTKSLFAMLGIIYGTMFGVMGVVSAPIIYFEEKERAEREKVAQAEREAALAKQAQQPTFLGDEPEPMPPSYEKAVGIIEEEIPSVPGELPWSAVSPAYEEPDPEFEALTRAMKEAGLPTE